MKPFDLKKALAGEPVITRDGRAVIRLVHLPEVKNTAYRLAAVIQGQDTPIPYYEDGRLIASVGTIDDLFMAPQKKTVWVNIWNDAKGNLWSTGRPFDTETEAEAHAMSYKANYVGTYPIEIEI